MTETKRSQFKKRAAALAVASCLSLAPWIAEAAGLGKITVYSALGQPLRAELELAANRDELAGMSARLAPVDAFRQAGIEFATALSDLRFSVDRRANGVSVVKVTSVKPVNEPFLDFLVELNWPTGRLVREYTFLLDPPDVSAKGAGAPVSVAEAKVVEVVRGGGAATQSPAQAPAAPVKERARLAPAKPAEQAAKPDGAETRVVQPGETLRKIATETKYDGVSLEQMLVGLYQNNPDAFIGKNINRLKSGAILGVPDKGAVAAVSDAEAKSIYLTQARDWNAYRQKLAAGAAAGAAREDAGGQAASGKITAKVEDKATPAEQAKDRVKIAKTELPGKPGDKSALSEADQIAKDKALKEAQERLALLEKNVTELQKLVDMKTQKLAELQQSAAKKDEPKPAEAVKPAEMAKPVELPKPVEAAKPVEAPAPTAVPAPVAEPEKPVEPSKPAEVKAPEAPKPVVAPQEKKPVPPPMPEPVEESFVDVLLADPLPLAGGAGLLALLGGYFMYKRRRENTASLETTAAPGPSSLGPNSVFRMTGGQSVDTGNTPPQTGDFSQTGPGTIDTDEVDPVAEADVYMAYGRDTQAEEILLEAMQKDPQRTAIHAKLLEIYANRRSVKQFETLASELYAQTGGAGAEWEKVAALGAALDPANPLYSGVAVPAAHAFSSEETMIVSPEELGRANLASVPELPPVFETEPLVPDTSLPELADDTLVIPEAPEVPMVEPTEPEPVPVQEDPMTLDFDLGVSDDPVQALDFSTAADEESPTATSVPELVAESGTDSALDFDLGTLDVAPVASDVPEFDLSAEVESDEAALGAVDFELDAAPAVVEPAVEAEDHDFSPEGTMVMPSAMDDAVSTYIGGDLIPEEEESAPEVVPEQEPTPEASASDIDFDLDIGSPATQTVVNPIIDDASTATIVNPLALQGDGLDMDAPDLLATSVNPGALDSDSLEFDVKLTDSVFLGQPMMQPDFDIGAINLDLGAEPAPVEPTASAEESLVEDAVSPALEPQAAESSDNEGRDAQWDEVNTKLDLAKAYEEMGDLEGARELLQEVVGEGPVDLVEQARAILARIGE